MAGKYEAGMPDDERITELTREVRMHNDFARRIPVLEQRIETLEKEINKIEEVQ